MIKIDAKRIWLISDTHLGVRSNSREWMDTIEQYFKEFMIPTLKKEYKPGDILIHCGDVFDSRQSINLYVMNKGLEIFEEINKIMPVYMIIGNHDIFMKYSNEINSLKMFKHIPGITIFEKPTMAQLGSKTALFMPWVDSHEEFMEIASKHSGDIMFCHTDIRGMTFNKFVKIEEGVDGDKFSNFQRVYSGHIHYGQKYKNVRMLGCPYEITRSDSGNTKKLWLLDLETDEETSFENTISPKFVKFKIDWILEQPIEKLQELFNNNFVDILVTPQWSLKFPFSSFSERVAGYRKINPIITDGEETMTDDGEIIDSYEEINLVNLIERHIEALPYSEIVKENLKRVSVKYYHEMLTELEDKKSYENQLD
jgi:DNA repair exonuclease SbcCD nuclease subunit